MALTTATIIALGGAAVGGGMNLIQAGKARDAQRKADKAAGRLMADAKSKIEKNYYEGLKIPTEAYDQAYEANAQAQRESVEALQQADSRTLAAGVGRVGALSNENTQKIRAQQAQEMFELDKFKRGAEEDMTQQLAQMDVAMAQDQAARAAQADEQVGMLQAGAANAFIGGITSAAQAQELNTMSKEDKLLSKTYKDNEALFKAEGIDRNTFLQNPGKYKIENGKITIVDAVVPVVKNKKPVVKEDKTEVSDYIAPSENFGFNMNDRLNTLRSNNDLLMDLDYNFG
jgi:hypothetical protein